VRALGKLCKTSGVSAWLGVVVVEQK